MAGKFLSNSKTLKRVKRLTAFACLLMNLLVLPGLGSLIAGCRTSGFLQATLALVGTALTTVLWAPMLTTIIRTGQLPEEVGQSIWGGLLGILIFVIAWVWALVTGLSILRRCRGGDL